MQTERRAPISHSGIKQHVESSCSRIFSAEQISARCFCPCACDRFGQVFRPISRTAKSRWPPALTISDSLLQGRLQPTKHFPKGPSAPTVYTLSPRVPMQGLLYDQSIYYLGTWTLRGVWQYGCTGGVTVAPAHCRSVRA